MFYSNGELAVAQIPKAGLRSINRWLGFPVVDNHEARKADTRVLFIRNPFERLRSAYSFFYAQGRFTGSWREFVDHALSTDDEHWRPQLEHVGDVPNRIHRFEHIEGYVDQYKPGILLREGYCTRQPTDDYRADDIAEFYAADYAAWLRA